MPSEILGIYLLSDLPSLFPGKILTKTSLLLRKGSYSKFYLLLTVWLPRNSIMCLQIRIIIATIQSNFHLATINTLPDVRVGMYCGQKEWPQRRALSQTLKDELNDKDSYVFSHRQWFITEASPVP